MGARIAVSRPIPVGFLMRAEMRPFVGIHVPRVFPEIVFECMVDFFEFLRQVAEKRFELLKKRTAFKRLFSAFAAQLVFKKRTLDHRGVEFFQFVARKLDGRKFGHHTTETVAATAVAVNAKDELVARLLLFFLPYFTYPRTRTIAQPKGDVGAWP